MNYIEHKGMKFEVEVLSVKHSYGRKRELVTPVAGSGESWVEGVKDSEQDEE